MTTYSSSKPAKLRESAVFFDSSASSLADDALEVFMTHRHPPEEGALSADDDAMVRGAALILQQHISNQEKPEGLVAEEATPRGIPSRRHTIRYYKEHGVTLPWLIVAATHLEGREQERTIVGQTAARAVRRIGSLVIPDVVQDTHRTQEAGLRSVTNQLISERYEKSNYNRYVKDGEARRQQRNDGISAAPLLWTMAAQVVGERGAQYDTVPTALAYGVAAGFMDAWEQVPKSVRGNYPPEVARLHDTIFKQRMVAVAHKSRRIREERAKLATHGITGREADKVLRNTANAGVDDEIQDVLEDVMVEAVMNVPKHTEEYNQFALAHRKKGQKAKQRRLAEREARKKLELDSSVRYSEIFQYADPVDIYARARAAFNYADNPYINGTEIAANAVEALRELREAGHREASRLLSEVEYDARDFLVEQLTGKLEAIKAGHVSAGEARYIHNIRGEYIKDKSLRSRVQILKMALADAALQYYGSRTHVQNPGMNGAFTVSLSRERMNAPDRRALRSCYVYDLTEGSPFYTGIRASYPAHVGAIRYNRIRNLYNDGQQLAGKHVKRERLPVACRALLTGIDEWMAENHRTAA